MLRRTLTVLLAVLALTLGAASYRQAEAARTQTQIADLCGQIPSFLAAFEYTAGRWPPNTVSPPDDVKWNLGYFTYMLRGDKQWCDQYASVGLPEAGRNAMLYHFGNASVALRQYQAAAQAAAPVVTATPAPVSIPPVPPSAHDAPQNPYRYNFTCCREITNPPAEFCIYFRCISSFWDGRGYVVQCYDELYSKSGGLQGACSGHAGVYRKLLGP
jgi:hypothetical protein